MNAKSTISVQLHLLILSFYTTDSSHDELDYVVVDRPTLGTISLVCKRWANTVRPELFSQLTLRSYGDADALLGLIRDPRSQISDYIRQLICTNTLWHTVTAKQPCRTGNLNLSSEASERQAALRISIQPWIHIVCSMGQTLLPSLRSIHVHTMGPFPGAQSLHVLHSIHPFHQQINVRGITHLTLDDLHFRSFQNVLRQLRQIPLSSLECTNVTWEDDFVSGETSIFWKWVTSSDPGGLIDYTMTKSSNNVAAAWTAIILARSRGSRLRPGDAHALFHISNAILHKSHSDMYTPDAAVYATREMNLVSEYTYRGISDSYR